MSAVVTDTHAAIWYLFQPDRLSTSAREAFNQATTAGDPIYLSVISLIEVRYLVEKGKLPRIAFDRLSRELGRNDAAVVPVPINMEVAQAVGQIPRDIVPDMPDRIIAATALSFHVPLITRDQQIQATSVQTIW